MMILILIIIILIPLFIFTAYKFIEYIDYRRSLSNLEKYKLTKNEKIIKNFEYTNKNYVISRYYNNSSSWSHLNLLLKNKYQKY